ncbi:hypothetical protein THRCLA_22260 [Thraustotheca clavata]|uniref:Uncharacterized protein n=1 Tax=Thraustotheca clavata TaxID=74557 RepID=A0A1V9Z7X0_9STRA|nr:hypothetical protein THRCLA_22260 [Thraustotheca clavata]
MDMTLFDTVDYMASGILLSLSTLLVGIMMFKYRIKVLQNPPVYVTFSMFGNMMLWSLFSIVFMYAEDNSTPGTRYNGTNRRYRRSCMHTINTPIQVIADAFLLALEFWILIASFELYTMIVYHHLLHKQSHAQKQRVVDGYTKVVYGLTIVFALSIFLTTLSPSSSNSVYCWLVSTTVVFNALAATLAGCSLVCLYVYLRTSMNEWPANKQNALRRVQRVILVLIFIFLFFCIPFLVFRTNWTFKQATNAVDYKSSSNRTSSSYSGTKYWKYIFHVINTLLPCSLGALLVLDWFKVAYAASNSITEYDNNALLSIPQQTIISHERSA